MERRRTSMMGTVLWESLQAWWPETILSIGALVVMLVGVWTQTGKAARLITWGVLAGCGVALWHVPALPQTATFFGLILCDPFSLVFRWLALGTIVVTCLLITASKELASSHLGECLGLVLLLGVGLMLMAEANHLLLAVVAMELVSLSAYLLVGFRADARSAEAALKYLLFGALSSGIMLFGMSLLFGLTGALSFPALRVATAALSSDTLPCLLMASTLVLAGLAFKVSMVPFHMWTPDAYEGAPVAVTALLSVGPKAAGLALFIRIIEALTPAWTALAPVLISLTVATMTLGNLVALVQTNVKRLLAYSTIAQVGYLLIGFSVHTPLGHEGLLVYLVAYLLMNFGVFACLVGVVNETGSESVEAFRGMAQRAPFVALMCTLCLLSLAGIPPLLGFFGKFLLFGAALQAHQPLLAIAGVVNSAIALYYYVSIVREMYFVAPASPAPLPMASRLTVTMGVCTVATLVLGLFPTVLLHGLVERTTVQLF